jgi:Raf kinase inhibitor-like YbhB/YbcL family protein
MNEQNLQVASPAFPDGGEIPQYHSGWGADVSPELRLTGLADDAVSLTVIMDDLDIPLTPAYNHWVIWNLPAQSVIPASIPAGADPANGARQGIGYGKNRYRGPKPPAFIRNRHRYRFTVLALDCRLTLDASARKKDLLRAMEGHIMQTGTLIGTYRNT